MPWIQFFFPLLHPSICLLRLCFTILFLWPCLCSLCFSLLYQWRVFFFALVLCRGAVFKQPLTNPMARFSKYGHWLARRSTTLRGDWRRRKNGSGTETPRSVNVGLSRPTPPHFSIYSFLCLRVGHSDTQDGRVGTLRGKVIDSGREEGRWAEQSSCSFCQIDKQKMLNGWHFLQWDKAKNMDDGV